MKTLETRMMRLTELRMEGGEGDKPLKLVGYGAVFDSPSDLLPFPNGEGSFREIIRPGAFAKSLAGGADVRLLINHAGLPLGRTVSGTLRLLEDSKGLRFETELDRSDPDVQAIIPKMKRGDLKECSFAFQPVQESWQVVNGGDVRELLEVDINGGDVSLVTYPAYPETSAALRSRKEWRSKNPVTKENKSMDTNKTDAAAKTEGETRATSTIAVEDPTLSYHCRYAIDTCRRMMDQLENVIQSAGSAASMKLSDADCRAIKECMDHLGSVRSKVGVAVRSLGGLSKGDAALAEEAEVVTDPAGGARAADPALEKRVAAVLAKAGVVAKV